MAVPPVMVWACERLPNNTSRTFGVRYPSEAPLAGFALRHAASDVAKTNHVEKVTMDQNISTVNDYMAQRNKGKWRMKQ